MTTEDSKTLKFLYTTFIGRCILKILTWRFISKLCGLFLDSKLSKFLIKPFVKNNKIDLNDYYSDNFQSFNDCFSRKIKDGKRIIEYDKSVLVSPSDGLVSCYKITNDLTFKIKNSVYTISSLLRDDKVSDKYRNGTCLVIRLCVNNYHRYIYPCDGIKGENVHIKGVLHTVRPIALENAKVFTENSREYTILKNKLFGDVTMMEVGALLVGRIVNYHEIYEFKKGEEKGMFKYGGSTIILLLEEKVKVDDKWFKSTKQGIETPIMMGEALGSRKA